MNSSSSSEQYESSGSLPTSSKHEKSRKRDRRASPPTDSDDDEDPFHFDSVLSSSPAKREDDSPSRALSSSLLRRASIVPVDPTAEPAPHRFSLLRERASEETIFVQEICDAEGRRWSLRVPASGLPEDMVHMLEELENLAVELGQALPRIVVTCSAESLSMKRMERDAAAVAANSLELLRPPPAVGYDPGTRLSLAREKHRIIDPEHSPEEPARSSEPPSAAIASASEISLTCIYLPEVGPSNSSCSLDILITSFQPAPEFLSGSSTSPVLQPADGLHSKSAAQAIQCPRQRAFFAALKEPQQPANSIAKRLIMMPHSSTKTESESKAAASEAAPSYPATPPARSRSRSQGAKSKSALPILKSNLKSSAPGPAVAVTEDRRRARWASLSKSSSPPPLPEGLRAPNAAQEQQQQQPLSVSDQASSHTKTNKNGAAMTIVPNGAGTSSALQHQHHAAAASSPPVSSSSQPPARNRNDPPSAEAQRSVSAPAPPTGRRLRHLFRRPPVRSASDPPLYSYSMRPAVNGGLKRPASEVVPAPREVVERRMPRLPSARDLLRKLT